MVFIVISNIKHEHIGPSIITIRFLTWSRHKMFSNKVTTQWMRTQAQETRTQKVERSKESARHEINCDHKREDNGVVNELHSRGLFWRNKERTQTVKKHHEENVECLGQLGTNQLSFNVCAQISVNTNHSLVHVVFVVVTFEGHGIRDTHGQVAEHGEVQVVFHLFKCKACVVLELMDCRIDCRVRRVDVECSM